MLKSTSDEGGGTATMLPGLLILCGFATLWACAAMAAAHLPPVAFVVPLAVSAALLVWGVPRAKRIRIGVPDVRRIVRFWSMVEIVAMVAAFTALPRLGRVNLIGPVFAIIVGAHFLPLARALAIKTYYLTGAAMILVGIVGLALPFPQQIIMVGGAAAAILWASAVHLVGARRLISGLAPFPRRHPIDRPVPDLPAHQPERRMADRRRHAPHLPVAALADREPKPAIRHALAEAHGRIAGP